MARRRFGDLCSTSGVIAVAGSVVVGLIIARRRLDDLRSPSGVAATAGVVVVIGSIGARCRFADLLTNQELESQSELLSVS